MDNIIKGKDLTKRALLIGLEYDDTLKGPYNDIILIYNILKDKDYQIKVITDVTTDEKNDNLYNIILTKIKWLSEADIMYFHFSGHSTNGKLLINKRHQTYISTMDLIRMSKITENKSLIAIFDCCNSHDMPLRWKFQENQMVSNSCEYNINSDIIFIGSSSGISRNITYKNKQFGSLSFSVYLTLKKEKSISIYKLYHQLSKIYKDFEMSERISIYTGKKYNIYIDIII